MTDELAKIEAANAALLREALTPIFAATLDLSAADVENVPTSMLTQFLSVEFYQSLMYQYHTGVLELIKLAHRGGLTLNHPLVDTVKFLHGLMQPEDAKNKTLIKLRDSTLALTISQHLFTSAQRKNLDLWNEYSGRTVTAQHLATPPFDTNTFAHLNGPAFVKMFTSLRLPIGETWYTARINQDNAVSVLMRHWQLIVFMMLFSTNQLTQVAKINLPKSQLAYYKELANHFAILAKLGSDEQAGALAPASLATVRV